MWFQWGPEIMSLTIGVELDTSLKPGQREILQTEIKRRGSVPLRETPSVGLPWWLSGKESTCQVGDVGSVPESGRSLEKEMPTYSSILAWEIPRTEEPGELQSMGPQKIRSDLQLNSNNPLRWQNCEMEPETTGSHVPCYVE